MIVVKLTIALWLLWMLSAYAQVLYDDWMDEQ